MKRKITDGNNSKIDVDMYIYLEEEGVTTLTPTCARALDETVGALLRTVSNDRLSGRFGGSKRTRRKRRKRKKRTLKL